MDSFESRACQAGAPIRLENGVSLVARHTAEAIQGEIGTADAHGQLRLLCGPSRANAMCTPPSFGTQTTTAVIHAFDRQDAFARFRHAMRALRRFGEHVKDLRRSGFLTVLNAAYPMMPDVAVS